MFFSKNGSDLGSNASFAISEAYGLQLFRYSFDLTLFFCLLFLNVLLGFNSVDHRDEDFDLGQCDLLLVELNAMLEMDSLLLIKVLGLFRVGCFEILVLRLSVALDEQLGRCGARSVACRLGRRSHLVSDIDLDMRALVVQV